MIKRSQITAASPAIVHKKYCTVNKADNSQNCQDRPEYSLDVHCCMF